MHALTILVRIGLAAILLGVLALVVDELAARRRARRAAKVRRQRAIDRAVAEARRTGAVTPDDAVVRVIPAQPTGADR